MKSSIDEYTIEISECLWLKVKMPEHDDDLFCLCDNVRGNVLIHREEIPGLIKALHEVEEAPKVI